MAKYLLKNNLPRVLGFGKIVLFPKINEVSFEKAMKLKTFKSFDDHLQEGTIAWVGAEPKLEKVEAKSEEDQEYILKGKSSKEAIAIVKETLSVPVLQGWLKEESRKEVKAAIEQMIKEVTTIKKDEKDTKEGEGAAAALAAKGGK